MQTAELHTEIIRGILNIDNVELLQIIKKIIQTRTTENIYKLTEEEKKILQERENQYTQLYNNEDVLNEIDERIAIFKEFSEEWLLLLGLNKFKPITIEEYNEKLEQGLKDFQENKILSHQDMKDEIQRWKTQEN